MNIQSIILGLAILVLVVIAIRYVSKDVNTLSGLSSGQTLQTIAPSSLATSNTNSSNFAYSIWYYIDDWNYRYGEPKVLFGRMSAPTPDTSATNQANPPPVREPCPSVVFGATHNNLIISLACYAGSDSPDPANKVVTHTCAVANIPIQKWVNIVISVYGRSLDVYLDGKLVRTCVLPGVAKIDPNASVYITPKGGFSGWTSRFQYYSDSLSPQDVWNIYQKGWGGSALGSIFGQYSVKVAVMKGDQEQQSFSV